MRVTVVFDVNKKLAWARRGECVSCAEFIFYLYHMFFIGNNLLYVKLSLARVCGFVDFDELFGVDVGVSLGAGQAGVA